MTDKQKEILLGAVLVAVGYIVLEHFVKPKAATLTGVRVK